MEEEEGERGAVTDPDSMDLDPLPLLFCLEDEDHKPRNPDTRAPYSAGFTGWECVCFV